MAVSHETVFATSQLKQVGRIAQLWNKRLGKAVLRLYALGTIQQQRRRSDGYSVAFRLNACFTGHMRN